MSLRYAASRFKGLAYGPKEGLQYQLRCLNGSMRRQIAAYQACESPEAHWAFAKKYYRPCQKPSEILGFLEWANTWQPRVIAEIGVANGGTTYLMANLITSVKRFVGIDYFPRNRKALHQLVPEHVALSFATGNSSSASTVEKVKKHLQGQAIDLLLIDGDHSYLAAKKDYETYLPLVRAGGWIAFHDIMPPELRDDGVATNGFPVETDRLWKDISEGKEQVAFIDDPKQHSYGIGAIRVE